MPLLLAVWKGRSKIFWWSCIRSWLERIPYQVNQSKLRTEKTIKGITTLKLKEPKTIAFNQIKSAFVDLFLHNR